MFAAYSLHVAEGTQASNDEQWQGCVESMTEYADKPACKIMVNIKCVSKWRFNVLRNEDRSI